MTGNKPLKNYVSDSMAFKEMLSILRRAVISKGISKVILEIKGNDKIVYIPRKVIKRDGKECSEVEELSKKARYKGYQDMKKTNL